MQKPSIFVKKKLKKSIYKKKKENKKRKKKNRKVRHHCHYKGEYRGAARSICNLKYNVPKKFLLFFIMVQPMGIT